ncbi:MAG: lipid II:glycine glycyltransferase FemX [Ignavibacteriales bacterium]
MRENEIKTQMPALIAEKPEDGDVIPAGIINGNITVETDSVSIEEWAEYLDLFEDASLYQTMAYARHFPGGRNTSHIVIRKYGRVIALSQARIITLPLISRGIAYVFWGPVWQLKGKPADPGVLHDALQAIYEEYVVKRNLMLRIVSGLTREMHSEYMGIFRSAGLGENEDYPRQRSIIIDLSPSIDMIRKRLTSKWRNRLNFAEKNDLEIIEGNSVELFLMFKDLYRQLLSIKELPVHLDMDNYISIQKELPERHKMHIVICRAEGVPVGGVVGTLMGSSAACLLAAANHTGRKLSAAFLLQWQLIKWLKANGCKSYDLGGIDSETNHGVYHFKAGLGGREVEYLGQFESCRSQSSRILVNTGEYLRKMKQKLLL